jgi:hypothetical protein
MQPIELSKRRQMETNKQRMLYGPQSRLSTQELNKTVNPNCESRNTLIGSLENGTIL